MLKHRIKPPRAIAAGVSCSAPSRVGVAADPAASAKGIGRTCDNDNRDPGTLTDVPAASPTAAAHRSDLWACAVIAMLFAMALFGPEQLACWLAGVFQ